MILRIRQSIDKTNNTSPCRGKLSMADSNSLLFILQNSKDFNLSEPIHRSLDSRNIYNTLIYTPAGGSERNALNFIIENDAEPLNDKKIIGTHMPVVVFLVANLYLPLIFLRYFFQSPEH